jgi:hypothetical protein
MYTKNGCGESSSFVIQFLDFLFVVSMCLLIDGVTSNPLLDLEGPSPKVQYVREDGSVIPEDELQELSPVNLLAAAVGMVRRDGSSEPASTASAVDSDPGNMFSPLSWLHDADIFIYNFELERGVGFCMC